MLPCSDRLAPPRPAESCEYRSDNISADTITRSQIRKVIVNEILLGKTVPNSSDVFLHARYGNRHGMIAGATGTGKSVSLMVMPRAFRASEYRFSSPT